MDTSYQDEANASQRPDRPDPPQPTQSIPMSYYSADAVTEFLRRNERLMGLEIPTYQVAVRRNRSGEARLELTLVPARMSPDTTMAIEGRRTETPREEWNVYPERNRSDVSQNLTEAVNFIDNDTNLDVDDGEEEGKVEEMVASPEGNPAISRAETWITMRKRKAGESRSAQPPKASSHAESWITMRKHKAGESRSAQPPKNTMADEVHRAEARRDEEDFCTVQHEGEQAQRDAAEAVNGDLNVKDEDVEEARKVEEQVKSPEANPAVSNPGSWITARKRKAGDTRSAQPPKRQFPGPTECKERAEELEQVGHEEEPWVEEGSQDGEELRRPEEGNLNVDGSPEEVLDDLEEVPAEFEDFDDSDETSSSRATDELVADIRLLFELEADEEFDVDEDEEDSEDESEDSFFLSERRLRRFAAAALERVAREDVNGDEDGVEAGEAVPVEEPEAEEGEAEGEAVDDAQQTVPVAVAAGQPPSPAPAAAAPVAPAQAGPAPPAHQAAAPAGGPMRRRGPRQRFQGAPQRGSLRLRKLPVPPKSPKQLPDFHQTPATLLEELRGELCRRAAGGMDAQELELTERLGAAMTTLRSWAAGKPFTQAQLERLQRKVASGF